MANINDGERSNQSENGVLKIEERNDRNDNENGVMKWKPMAKK